jgi:hypothetical protein
MRRKADWHNSSLRFSLWEFRPSRFTLLLLLIRHLIPLQQLSHYINRGGCYALLCYSFADMKYLVAVFLVHALILAGNAPTSTNPSHNTKKDAQANQAPPSQPPPTQNQISSSHNGKPDQPEARAYEPTEPHVTINTVPRIDVKRDWIDSAAAAAETNAQVLVRSERAWLTVKVENFDEPAAGDHMIWVEIPITTVEPQPASRKLLRPVNSSPFLRALSAEDRENWRKPRTMRTEINLMRGRIAIL